MQDEDNGIVLQSTIEGHVIQIDPQVISRIIGVPVLQISTSPFNEVLVAPSLDDLREFFHAIPQAKEWATNIRIDAFSPLHSMLAKIVQHNLWPTVRMSDLIQKHAQFLYVIIMRWPFCLCKHILNIMMEARDENTTGLPFSCLITQIIMQSGIDIFGEPKMKIQDPLGNQILMKSNAQLRHEGQDEAPQPPPIHVEMPAVPSSSQTSPPPSQSDAILTQILASLESLHGGMSLMQRVVHSINLLVERCQLDIQECLQHHHLACDNEDHPTLAEEDWFCLVSCWFLFWDIFFYFPVLLFGKTL
jgi:hypothetical protein